jgi:hypothetical protein
MGKFRANRIFRASCLAQTAVKPGRAGCRIIWPGKERGQALVLAALSMMVVVGFVALAVDVGFLLTVKRRMQTAADAGAIAAATALRAGGNLSALTEAADNVASLNGFSAKDVQVYSPPQSGEASYLGDPHYVEVDVAEAEPTYFLKALGYDSITVSARAISGAVPSPACVYALSGSSSQALRVYGAATNVSANCAVIDNSTSGDALTIEDGASLRAAAIGVAGNYSGSGFHPKPVTGIAPVADPLAGLPPPPFTRCSPAPVTDAGSFPPANNPSANGAIINVPAKVFGQGISLDKNYAAASFDGGTYGNHITISGDVAKTTFNAGQYQAGAGQDSIDISGATTAVFKPDGNYTFCGAVSFSGADNITLSPGLYEGGIRIGSNVQSVTFNPGTYIINGGGITVAGNTTLTGSGVTFFLTTGDGYGPVKFLSRPRVSLSAPLSGPYKGILFFQDRSIIPGGNSYDSIITGDSSSIFDGSIYFPSTGLTYSGNSSPNGYTFLIADRINVAASSTLGNDYSSLTGGPPIQSSALYE